jgi:hypothetical protein
MRLPLDISHVIRGAQRQDGWIDVVAVVQFQVSCFLTMHPPPYNVRFTCLTPSCRFGPQLHLEAP